MSEDMCGVFLFWFGSSTSGSKTPTTRVYLSDIRHTELQELRHSLRCQIVSKLILPTFSWSIIVSPRILPRNWMTMNSARKWDYFDKQTRRKPDRLSSPYRVVKRINYSRQWTNMKLLNWGGAKLIPPYYQNVLLQ